MSKRGKRYYTLTEAAAELGMKLPSVSRAARKGRLVTVMVGRVRMVAEAALEDYSKINQRGQPRVWKPREPVAGDES